MYDAAQFFTQADEANDYARTREALRAYQDKQLVENYHETLRASFDRMFGHNARQYFNLVADELIRRGITEIPNIFGPIQVKHIS